MATSGLSVFLPQAEYAKNASLKQRGSRGLIRAQFSPTQIGRLKKQPQVRQATERGANGVFGGTSFFSSLDILRFCGTHKISTSKIKSHHENWNFEELLGISEKKQKRHIIACTAFFSFGFETWMQYIPYWTAIPWKICVSQNSSGGSSAFVLRDGGVSLVKVWKKIISKMGTEER